MSMTHLDRAIAMTEALPKLKNLQQEQHRLKQYITREDQLRTGAELLAGLADITRELRARKVEPTGFLDACSGHRREVQRVATEFKDDMTSIIAQSPKTFWYPLEQLPGKVNKGVLEAWKEYVEQNIPPIQAAILSILASVPGLTTKATEVGHLLVRMRGLGDNLPDKDGFESVQTLAQQITEAWDELDGDGLPQSVLDFLRGAHSQAGANLFTLTEEVSDWLEQKDLVKKYVVKAK